MRGILPEPLRARKWKADFSGTVNEGVAQEADQIRRALSRDALGVRLGYLDAARLGPEVARLLGGLTGDDCTDSWDLVDLFALEVWLRVFLTGERASAVPTLPPQEGVA
jgi:hypothetical protein